MAKITTDDLAHIGELLAVKFDERSAAVTPEQLSSLLASFNVVQSAPTTPPPTLPPKVDVADSAHADALTIAPEAEQMISTLYGTHRAPLRTDKPTSPTDRESVLANAPHSKGDFIQTKPVF